MLFIKSIAKHIANFCYIVFLILNMLCFIKCEKDANYYCYCILLHVSAKYVKILVFVGRYRFEFTLLIRNTSSWPRFALGTGIKCIMWMDSYYNAKIPYYDKFWIFRNKNLFN